MNQHVSISYEYIGRTWPMPKMARTTPTARMVSKYMLLRISNINTSFSTTVTWDSEHMPYYGIPNAREVKRSMLFIATQVLRRYPDVTLDDVKGPRRRDYLVKARYAVIDAIKTQRPDLSFPQIGRFLGGRDHTTILYALNAVARMRASGEWIDL